MTNNVTNVAIQNDLTYLCDEWIYEELKGDVE